MFFIKYCTIGLFNTFIHWTFFLIFINFSTLDQSISNLLGFLISTFIGFYINCIWTFKVKLYLIKFLSYLVFMGSVNFFIGFFADFFRILPIFTLLITSISSVIIGFTFSKFLLRRA